MSLVKALVPSMILTLMVGAIAGFSGSRVNMLNVESAAIGGWPFYWSWPLFLTVTAINCMLIAHLGNKENA